MKHLTQRNSKEMILTESEKLDEECGLIIFVIGLEENKK
jgi:hypothetical protein